MKIVSWNCHYGLDELKAKALWDEYPNADIFVIQECKRTDIDAFKYEWKFKNWYGDDLEYSDLGVAVFSKSHKIEFIDEFNRNFRYVVPYKVITNNEFALLAVWTKPVPYEYDDNVVKAVESYKKKNLLGGNVVIIGDFNTGYNEVNDENRKRYPDLVKKLNGYKNASSDKPEEFEKTFFFDRNRKGYINDFCFISENFNGKDIKFNPNTDWKKNDFEQERWRGLSDHCPISVEFDF